MDQAKLKEMENMDFKTIDSVDNNIGKLYSARITDANIANMPGTYEDNQGILRERIIEIFEEKLGGKKTLIYEYCDIDRTNFGRYLKGSYGITKENLVKFIIGLQLGLDTAKELLRLNGTPLDTEKCRFDYIAELAISDKDDLEDFMDELVKYGCSDIRCNVR